MTNDYIDVTCMFGNESKENGVSASQLKDIIASIITIEECGLSDIVPDYILCETKRSRLFLAFKRDDYRSILVSTKSRSSKIIDSNFDVFVEVFKMFNDRLVTDSVSTKAGVKHVIVHKVPDYVDIEDADFDGDDYVEYYEQDNFTTEFTDSVELVTMSVPVNEPLYKLQGIDFSDLPAVEKDLMLRLCSYNAIQIIVASTITFTATSLSGSDTDKYVEVFKSLKV